MADGKIYIIVTDQLPGGGGPLVPDKPKEKEKESALGDYARHRFFNFIESQAKQALNYSISNIGNFTGDYVKQQQVANLVSFINFGVEFGNAIYSGFKYGGGYGAAVGAAIVIASKAINMGQDWLSNAAEVGRQNRAINQLRERVGMNNTNNGNRGTEY